MPQHQPYFSSANKSAGSVDDSRHWHPQKKNTRPQHSRHYLLTLARGLQLTVPDTTLARGLLLTGPRPSNALLRYMCERHSAIVGNRHSPASEATISLVTASKVTAGLAEPFLIRRL